MKHPVVWFEVLARDGERTQKFFTDLFGWKMNADNPLRYGMVDTAGATRGIPGGVGGAFEGTRPWVTFYVETADIAATLAAAERLGGKTVVPVKQLPGVTFAVFEAPEGHVIGLIESRPA